MKQILMLLPLILIGCASMSDSRQEILNAVQRIDERIDQKSAFLGVTPSDHCAAEKVKTWGSKERCVDDLIKRQDFARAEIQTLQRQRDQIVSAAIQMVVNRPVVEYPMQNFMMPQPNPVSYQPIQVQPIVRPMNCTSRGGFGAVYTSCY